MTKDLTAIPLTAIAFTAITLFIAYLNNGPAVFTFTNFLAGLPVGTIIGALSFCIAYFFLRQQGSPIVGLGYSIISTVVTTITFCLLVTVGGENGDCALAAMLFTAAVVGFFSGFVGSQTAVLITRGRQI